ncbi:MAG: hypothetical protein RL660_2891 [Bacteroidota bacterium]
MVHTKMHFAPVISNLVNELFNDTMLDDRVYSRGHYPKANIVETENGYTISFLVPGVNKADIKLALEKNVLSVNYTHSKESEQQAKHLLKEFEIRSFSRKFTLGKNIDATSITAKYDNGILTISLTKKEEEINPATTIEVL